MAKPTRVVNSTDYTQEKIASMENTTTDSSFKQGIINTLYPIGSIMMRYDTKNPNTLPGFSNTTWTQLSTGRYIMSSTSAGTIGGSSTTDGTAITTAMMPSHTHSFSATSGNQSANHSHSLNITSGSSGNHAHTLTFYNDDWSNTGGNDSIAYKRAYPGTTYDVGSAEASSKAWTYSSNSAGVHTHVITGSSGTDSVNHTHSVSGTTGSNGSGNTHTHTYSPPYLTLVMWRRSA